MSLIMKNSNPSKELAKALMKLAKDTMTDNEPEENKIDSFETSILSDEEQNEIVDAMNALVDVVREDVDNSTINALSRNSNHVNIGSGVVSPSRTSSHEGIRYGFEGWNTSPQMNTSSGVQQTQPSRMRLSERVANVRNQLEQLNYDVNDGRVLPSENRETLDSINDRLNSIFSKLDEFEKKNQEEENEKKEQELEALRKRLHELEDEKKKSEIQQKPFEDEVLDFYGKEGKKFMLCDKEVNGLWRIRACRDFGDVKKGDYGGLVESEDNLSQYGECWIYKGAVVRGKRKVFGTEKVIPMSNPVRQESREETKVVEKQTMETAPKEIA